MNFDYLKQFMDRLTENLVPGNSVVVYKDCREVFRYSSGYSDLENRKKMTGNEYMYIYSCSKVTTVTAALQLYEKGLFLLDDPLYEYIPDFSGMNVRNADGTVSKANNNITIRDLFRMTSGFSYNTAYESFIKLKEESQGRMETLSVIKTLAKEPLSFEPGTHWQYGLSHDVLACLVEVVSGKRFCEYVTENIFKPLEMNESFYHETPEILDGMAEQYIYHNNSNINDIAKLQSLRQSMNGCIVNNGKTNSLIYGSEYDSGGAGIITKVYDYAKLAAALSNGGLGLTGERILSDGTIGLMRENQLNAQMLHDYNWGHLKGYGYGLGVRTMIDRAASGHTGNYGEFGWGGAAGATILVDPEIKLGVFYAHHMLNPHEDYYQPRLRNVIYSCLER